MILSIFLLLLDYFSYLSIPLWCILIPATFGLVWSLIVKCLTAILTFLNVLNGLFKKNRGDK